MKKKIVFDLVELRRLANGIERHRERAQWVSALDLSYRLTVSWGGESVYVKVEKGKEKGKSSKRDRSEGRSFQLAQDG